MVLHPPTELIYAQAVESLSLFPVHFYVTLAPGGCL